MQFFLLLCNRSNHFKLFSGGWWSLTSHNPEVSAQLPAGIELKSREVATAKTLKHQTTPIITSSFEDLMDSEVVKLFDGCFLFVLTLKFIFIAQVLKLHGRESAVAHEYEP